MGRKPRGLGARHFEFRDQAIDPDDVGIDGSAVVAARRYGEGDVPELRRDASGLTEACSGFAEPGFANPFVSVARLATGHGFEYGWKSEAGFPASRLQPRHGDAITVRPCRRTKEPIDVRPCR